MTSNAELFADEVRRAEGDLVETRRLRSFLITIMWHNRKILSEATLGEIAALTSVGREAVEIVRRAKRAEAAARIENELDDITAQATADCWNRVTPEVKQEIKCGSGVGRRAVLRIERALDRIRRRAARRPALRFAYSQHQVYRRPAAAPRRKRAERRAAASASRAGTDPPGPEDAERRPTASRAALERDNIDNNPNISSIPQTVTDSNIDAPAIGELWAGDFAELEPLLLLMRDGPGESWEAIGISVEHAADLLTRGSA